MMSFSILFGYIGNSDFYDFQSLVSIFFINRNLSIRLVLFHKKNPLFVPLQTTNFQNNSKFNEQISTISLPFQSKIDSNHIRKALEEQLVPWAPSFKYKVKIETDGNFDTIE